MMRVFMAILCSLWAVCSVSAQSNRKRERTGRRLSTVCRLWNGRFLCTRYFEGWHDQSCYPYVVGGTVYKKVKATRHAR